MIPHMSRIVCEFVESLKYDLFAIANRRASSALPEVRQRTDVDVAEEERQRLAQIEKYQ